MIDSLWVSLIVLPASLALLIMASDYFLNGALAIASRFRLPDFIVGSLIVAIGTSAPELSINIIASLEQQGDIVISNLVGSNIVNICLGIGLAGFFATYHRLGMVQMPSAIVGLAVAAGLLLVTLLTTDAQGMAHLPRIAGFILLAGFAAYIGHSIYTHRNGEAEENDATIIHRPLGMSLLYLLGGAAGMALFADQTVNSAVFISDYVGIPQAVIGATVIAAGSSLPEIVSCVAAARRKMPDIVFGNIFGSQIFNLLAILGVSAVVSPVTFTSALAVDMGVLIAATLAMLGLGLGGLVARRAMPGLLVAIYGAYALYLVTLSV